MPEDKDRKDRTEEGQPSQASLMDTRPARTRLQSISNLSLPDGGNAERSESSGTVRRRPEEQPTDMQGMESL